MENENKDNVGTDVTTETTGANQATEISKKSFEELLQDKDYQSAFDKKITQSLQTAKTKWEEEQRTKLAEAEKLAKMDADEKKNYELTQWKERAEKAEKQNSINLLKSETMKQASEKGISLEFINTLNFEYETAESIKSKLEVLEKAVKKEREIAISEYSKEDAPQTGDKIEKNNLSGYEKFLKNMK